MDEDELAQVNAEMRFITLELMKIASKRRAPFREVANEFVENVYTLKRAIRHNAFSRARRHAKREAQTDPAARKGFAGRP
ncbi:MAG: hypothetical protein PHF51_00940 [Candidatus ainarchaeum sp.]|nr:hypothetical protein [Candidatus ainarchaeum sp.]